MTYFLQLRHWTLQKDLERESHMLVMIDFWFCGSPRSKRSGGSHTASARSAQPRRHLTEPRSHKKLTGPLHMLSRQKLPGGGRGPIAPTRDIFGVSVLEHRISVGEMCDEALII